MARSLIEGGKKTTAQNSHTYQETNTVVPPLIAHSRHNKCAIKGGAQLREELVKSHAASCRVGTLYYKTGELLALCLFGGSNV